MSRGILRRQFKRLPEFARGLIQLLSLQVHYAQMKVRLLEVRLQTQCFLERDLRVGKLISLRQDGSKFIPQVGALRSEFYCTPHLRQRLISRPLTQNPRQHAVRLCVPWSSLQRRARLLLALCGFPLLRQHARQSQPRLNEPGLRFYRGSKMRHRGIRFPLLGQHPAQRRLRLRVVRSKVHRLLKFSARAREIPAFESLLPMLQGQSLRGFRRSSRRLGQRGNVHRERCHGKETNEPKRVSEHDEWKRCPVFSELYRTRVNSHEAYAR